MNDDADRLKALLDQTYDWPCSYMFKFISPAANECELNELFKGFTLKRRESRNGKYVSVTIHATMAGSVEIIALYAAAGEIEGVIAL